MEPSVLIGIFIVIFAVTWRYIWKRDILYGIAYLSFFIYAIFAQIGYAYFPELSVFIEAYFGPTIFFETNIFVTLSFITFFLCFLFLHRHLIKKPSFYILKSKSRYTIIFHSALCIHFLFLGLYFYQNYDSINYDNASNEIYQVEMGFLYIIFGILFKLSVVVNLILYFLYRVRSETAPKINRHAILFFLVLGITLFVMISLKIGSRTDLLALTVSIVVIELYDSKKRVAHRTNKWLWFKISMLSIVTFSTLTLIEYTRGAGAEMGTLPEMILLKDYYAPYHILIAAMAYEYVNPLEVIISNGANALILLKQPYLQATVADIFNPGLSTRSASYAFYIFSEGFIFMGFFGFLYNGFIIFGGLAIWRAMANSNYNYYNHFMTGLISTQIVHIARNQSSYFLKDIYTYFIPAMLMFFLATGWRPILKKHY